MPNQYKVQYFDLLNVKLGFGGRLTLTSGVPITGSDVTGAGTLYYTPFIHDQIMLYDNTNWKAYTFIETSLALVITSGKNYDVFGFISGGSLALELSAAWTNDTTRADAIVYQNGIQVKSSNKTRVFLGTIRASGANTTEDSLLNRWVINEYNFVPRPFFACPGYIDNGSGHTFTSNSTTWVQANGGSSNTITYLNIDNRPITYVLNAAASNDAGLGNYSGIGHDTTSTALTESVVSGTSGTGIGAGYSFEESLGYHFLSFIVAVQGGNGTWYPDDTRHGGAHNPFVSFISGNVLG